MHLIQICAEHVPSTRYERISKDASDRRCVRTARLRCRGKPLHTLVMLTLITYQDGRDSGRNGANSGVRGMQQRVG